MYAAGLQQGNAFRVKNGKNIYYTDHIGSTTVFARLLCKHSEDAIAELELDQGDEVILVEARTHLTHEGWRHLKT